MKVNTVVLGQINYFILGPYKAYKFILGTNDFFKNPDKMHVYLSHRLSQDHADLRLYLSGPSGSCSAMKLIDNDACGSGRNLRATAFVSSSSA